MELLLVNTCFFAQEVDICIHFYDGVTRKFSFEICSESVFYAEMFSVILSSYVSNIRKLQFNGSLEHVGLILERRVRKAVLFDQDKRLNSETMEFENLTRTIEKID